MPNTMHGLKIFSSEQTKRLDAFTVKKEGISSLQLMERASTAFVREFVNHFPSDQPVQIFCGWGNNGGDGLAIARLLLDMGYKVTVFICNPSNNPPSQDFALQLDKLSGKIVANRIQSIREIPTFLANSIIIDALLGSGLNREVNGFLAELIQWMNNSGLPIVSVDIASGLFASSPSRAGAVVRPTLTFSFQLPKLSFLLPQNAAFTGEVKLLDIGLDQAFIEEEPTDYAFLQKEQVSKLLKKRPKYAHKGTFGHVLVFAGGLGKMGAALLCAKAALRTGCGLLTLLVEERQLPIVQASIWEVMCLPYAETGALPAIGLKDKFTYGIGPGIGQEEKAKQFVEELLTKGTKPVVLDADALNILASHSHLLKKIPAHSILTPHPKEFERLVGGWNDEYERLEKQKNFSREHTIYLILKGAHSSISTPNGKVFFNSTGNPGMATGGSGDVLTGILTSLLAQNYSPEEAAILGVFLHGLAGDFAATEKSEQSLLASDIIDYLPYAFKELIKA